jgi:DNA/RNA-binding domain of Phe-tRNA-synthetase-like protein
MKAENLMLSFAYHPEIFAKFPTLRAGIILAHGLKNAPTPVELQNVFLDEQRLVLARIGDTSLSEIESLAAWRAAFRLFGVDPTKYRSAPEALLRRLTKKGDIPSINALVDVCNLVSIRYALPVAAFDGRNIQGSITVHFAEGSEPFTNLGQEGVQHPEQGEVVFTDEQKVVIARRWCWRQSDQSSAQLDTRDAIITTEAQHENNLEDVSRALNDLGTLLRQYLGGSYTSGLLDPSHPSISEADNN